MQRLPSWNATVRSLACTSCDGSLDPLLGTDDETLEEGLSTSGSAGYRGMTLTETDAVHASDSTFTAMKAAAFARLTGTTERHWGLRWAAPDESSSQEAGAFSNRILECMNTPPRQTGEHLYRSTAVEDANAPFGGRPKIRESSIEGTYSAAEPPFYKLSMHLDCLMISEIGVSGSNTTDIGELVPVYGHNFSDTVLQATLAPKEPTERLVRVRFNAEKRCLHVTTKASEDTKDWPEERMLRKVAETKSGAENNFQKGDVVTVVKGYEKYSDAGGGPLKLGDLGKISSAGPVSVCVEAKGRSWWYQVEALINLRSSEDADDQAESGLLVRAVSSQPGAVAVLYDRYVPVQGQRIPPLSRMITHPSNAGEAGPSGKDIFGLWMYNQADKVSQMMNKFVVPLNRFLSYSAVGRGTRELPLEICEPQISMEGQWVLQVTGTDTWSNDKLLTYDFSISQSQRGAYVLNTFDRKNMSGEVKLRFENDRYTATLPNGGIVTFQPDKGSGEPDGSTLIVCFRNAEAEKGKSFENQIAHKQFYVVELGKVGADVAACMDTFEKELQKLNSMERPKVGSDENKGKVEKLFNMIKEKDSSIALAVAYVLVSRYNLSCKWCRVVFDRNAANALKDQQRSDINNKAQQWKDTQEKFKEHVDGIVTKLESVYLPQSMVKRLSTIYMDRVLNQAHRGLVCIKEVSASLFKSQQSEIQAEFLPGSLVVQVGSVRGNGDALMQALETLEEKQLVLSCQMKLIVENLMRPTEDTKHCLVKGNAFSLVCDEQCAFAGLVICGTKVGETAVSIHCTDSYGKETEKSTVYLVDFDEKAGDEKGSAGIFLLPLGEDTQPLQGTMLTIEFVKGMVIANSIGVFGLKGRQMWTSSSKSQAIRGDHIFSKRESSTHEYSRKAERIQQLLKMVGSPRPLADRPLFVRCICIITDIGQNSPTAFHAHSQYWLGRADKYFDPNADPKFQHKDDYGDQALLQCFQHHYRAVAVSPDSAIVAAISHQHFTVWSLVDGKMIQRQSVRALRLSRSEGSTPKLKAIAWRQVCRQDARSLILGCANGDIILYEQRGESGRLELRNILDGVHSDMQSKAVTHITMTLDNNVVVSTTKHKCIMFSYWELVRTTRQTSKTDGTLIDRDSAELEDLLRKEEELKDEEQRLSLVCGQQAEESTGTSIIACISFTDDAVDRRLKGVRKELEDCKLGIERLEKSLKRALPESVDANQHMNEKSKTDIAAGENITRILRVAVLNHYEVALLCIGERNELRLFVCSLGERTRKPVLSFLILPAGSMAWDKEVCGGINFCAVSSRPSILVSVPNKGVAVCNMLHDAQATSQKMEMRDALMVPFNTWLGQPVTGFVLLSAGAFWSSEPDDGTASKYKRQALTVDSSDVPTATNGGTVTDGVTPEVFFLHNASKQGKKGSSPDVLPDIPMTFATDAPPGGAAGAADETDGAAVVPLIGQLGRRMTQQLLRHAAQRVGMEHAHTLDTTWLGGASTEVQITVLNPEIYSGSAGTTMLVRSDQMAGIVPTPQAQMEDVPEPRWEDKWDEYASEQNVDQEDRETVITTSRQSKGFLRDYFVKFDGGRGSDKKTMEELRVQQYESQTVYVPTRVNQGKGYNVSLPDFDSGFIAAVKPYENGFDFRLPDPNDPKVAKRASGGAASPNSGRKAAPSGASEAGAEQTEDVLGLTLYFDLDELRETKQVGEVHVTLPLSEVNGICESFSEISLQNVSTLPVKTEEMPWWSTTVMETVSQDSRENQKTNTALFLFKGSRRKPQATVGSSTYSMNATGKIIKKMVADNLLQLVPTEEPLPEAFTREKLYEFRLSTNLETAVGEAKKAVCSPDQYVVWDKSKDQAWVSSNSYEVDGFKFDQSFNLYEMVGDRTLILASPGNEQNRIIKELHAMFVASSKEDMWPAIETPGKVFCVPKPVVKSGEKIKIVLCEGQDEEQELEYKQVIANKDPDATQVKVGKEGTELQLSPGRYKIYCVANTAEVVSVYVCPDVMEVQTATVGILLQATASTDAGVLRGTAACRKLCACAVEFPWCIQPSQLYTTDGCAAFLGTCAKRTAADSGDDVKEPTALFFRSGDSTFENIFSIARGLYSCTSSGVPSLQLTVPGINEGALASSTREPITCLKMNESGDSIEVRPLLKASSSQWLVVRIRYTPKLYLACVPLTLRGTLQAEIFSLEFWDTIYGFLSTGYGLVFSTCYDLWFIPTDDLRRILEKLRDTKNYKIEEPRPYGTEEEIKANPVKHVYGYSYRAQSTFGMYNVKYVTSIKLKDGIKQEEPSKSSPDTDFAMSMTILGKDVFAAAFEAGMCVQFFQYNAMEKTYSVTVSNPETMNRIQMAYLAHTYTPDTSEGDSKKKGMKMKMSKTFYLRYLSNLLPYVCRFSENHICVLTKSSLFFYPKPQVNTIFDLKEKSQKVYGKLLPVIACLGQQTGSDVTITYSYQGRQEDLTLPLPRSEKAKANAQEQNAETQKGNDVKAIAFYENDTPEVMIFVLLATQLNRSDDLVRGQFSKQKSFYRVSFWTRGPQDNKEIDSWDSMLVSHDMHYVVTYSTKESIKARIFDGQLLDAYWDGKDFLPANKVEAGCFSRDSAYLVFCTAENIIVIACESREIKFTLHKDTLNLLSGERIGFHCHSTATDAETTNSDHVIIGTSHQRLIYQSLFSPLNFVITPEYLVRDSDEGQVTDNSDRSLTAKGMVAMDLTSTNPYGQTVTVNREDTYVDTRTMVAENTNMVMLAVPDLRKRSGKWYYEIAYLHHDPNTTFRVGWADDDYFKEQNKTHLGDAKHTWAFEPFKKVKYSEGSQSESKSGDVTPGSRIGCAIDFDEKQMLFCINGTWEERPMSFTVTGDLIPCVSGNNLSVTFCTQLEGSGAIQYPPRNNRRILGEEYHSQIMRPISEDKFAKYALLKAGLFSTLQIPDMNFTSSPVELGCAGAHAARIRPGAENSTVWWRPAERQLCPAGQRGRGSWIAVDLGSDLFCAGIQLQVLKGQRVCSAKLQVRPSAPGAPPVEFDLEDEKINLEDVEPDLTPDTAESQLDNMFFKFPPMKVRYIRLKFLKCQVGPKGFGLRLEVFHKVPRLMDFVASSAAGQEYKLYYGVGDSSNVDLQVLNVGVANKVTFGDLLRAYNHKTKDYQLKSSGLLYDLNKFKLLRAGLYVCDQWNGMRQVQWSRTDSELGVSAKAVADITEEGDSVVNVAIDEDTELKSLDENKMVLAPGFGVAYRSLFHQLCSSNFDKLDEILAWLLKASVPDVQESAGPLTRALPMVHLLVHSLVPKGTGVELNGHVGHPYPVRGNPLSRPMDIMCMRISALSNNVRVTDAENLHMSITLVKTMLPDLLDNLTALGEESWWHVKNVLSSLPGEVIIGFEIDKALLATPIRRESERSVEDGVGVNSLAELNVVNLMPLGERTGHMRLVVAIPGILGDAKDPKRSLLYRVTHAHEHGGFIRNTSEYYDNFEKFCRTTLISNVINYKWNAVKVFFYLESICYFTYLIIFTSFSIEYATLHSEQLPTEMVYLKPTAFLSAIYFIFQATRIVRDGPREYFIRGQEWYWNLMDCAVAALLCMTFYNMYMTVRSYRLAAAVVAPAVAPAAPVAAYGAAPVTTPLLTTTAAPAVLSDMAEARRSTSLTYLSVCAVLFWTRTTFYGLGFEQTGQFMRVVFIILEDIVYFFVMVIFFLVAFAHGMYLFFHKDVLSVELGDHFETFGGSIITSYRMLLGDYPIKELERHKITLFYFIIFTMLVTLTLLNVLIAKMNDSYARASNNARGQYLVKKAELTAKLESKYWVIIDKLYGENYNTWLFFEKEVLAKSEKQQLGEISEIRSEMQRHSDDVKKMWDSVQRVMRQQVGVPVRGRHAIAGDAEGGGSRGSSTQENVPRPQTVAELPREHESASYASLNVDTVRSVVQDSMKDEFISQNQVVASKIDEVVTAISMLSNFVEEMNKRIEKLPQEAPVASAKSRPSPAPAVAPSASDAAGVGALSPGPAAGAAAEPPRPAPGPTGSSAPAKSSGYFNFGRGR